MADIDKTIRYNKLMNIYSSLLTDKQKKILEEYFVYDLSLSEIAEELEVSRAAVEDTIKKGASKLDSLEESLHLLEKKEKVLNVTKTLKDKTKDKEIKSLADEIERIIE